MKLLKLLIKRIKRLFNLDHNRLSSRDEEHWVNHIYDETVSWPNKGMMWMNLHGFDEGPGKTYWVGMDIRSFGIRAADYVVRCKNKTTYDKWIHEAFHDPEKVLYKLREDPNLIYKYGDNVEVKFIFKWGDDDKSFNVRFSTDCYAEER